MQSPADGLAKPWGGVPVGIASLVCPAGHGDEAGGRKALKGMKKQGAGLRPPVSRFWAVLLALVLESVRVGAVPVSISLSEGNGDLILTNYKKAVIACCCLFCLIAFNPLCRNGLRAILMLLIIFCCSLKQYVF